MQQIQDIVTTLKFLKTDKPETQELITEAIAILSKLCTKEDVENSLNRLTNNIPGTADYCCTDPAYTEIFMYMLDALSFSQKRMALKDGENNSMYKAYKNAEKEYLLKMVAMIQSYGKNL